MPYAVYTTDRFEKEVSKISLADQEIIKEIYIQLKENPYTGDQIRYRFFREKRIKEKRIYYLVYDDLNAVLIVAISGKKAQEETIDKIVRDFDDFRSFLERAIKED